MYHAVASDITQTRLKRQVTFPPTPSDESSSVVPDKSALNKNGQTNTKKPLDVNVPVSGPTAQPADGTNPITVSTNTNVANASLPTQSPSVESTNTNGASPDGSNSVDLTEGDVFFDGNSTYPYDPTNTSYYQNRNVSVTKVHLPLIIRNVFNDKNAPYQLYFSFNIPDIMFSILRWKLSNTTLSTMTQMEFESTGLTWRTIQKQKSMKCCQMLIDVLQ